MEVGKRIYTVKIFETKKMKIFETQKMKIFETKK